jgi:hypothetical protein
MSAIIELLLEIHKIDKNKAIRLAKKHNVLSEFLKFV